MVSGAMNLNQEKIKSELKRIGQTQTWLASELGITRQAVSYWFARGVRSFRTIERIAKILKIDPKDLIK